MPDEIEPHAAYAAGVQPLESRSVKLPSAMQTPRNRTGSEAMQSSIASLSVPWQEACTITARPRPSRAWSAASASLGASSGV